VNVARLLKVDFRSAWIIL